LRAARRHAGAAADQLELVIDLHTTRALERMLWQDPVDPLEGVILHEPMLDAGLGGS
jgi:hypothetical protein